MQFRRNEIRKCMPRCKSVEVLSLIRRRDPVAVSIAVHISNRGQFADRPVIQPSHKYERTGSAPVGIA